MFLPLTVTNPTLECLKGLQLLKSILSNNNKKETSTLSRYMISYIKMTLLNHYEIGNVISTHQVNIINIYQKLLRMGNKMKVKSRKDQKN